MKHFLHCIMTLAAGLMAVLPAAATHPAYIEHPAFTNFFTFRKTTGTSTQDMVIQGDTAIRFSDSMKKIEMFNLRTRRYLKSLKADVEEGVHCNVVSLGRKYAATDPWPLFYVAKSSNKHTECVYRLVGDSLKKVQTITFTGCGNSLVNLDCGGDSMWVTNWKGSRGANIVRMAAPKVSDGDVTINLDKEPNYFPFDFGLVIQGITVRDGIMYQTRGYGWEDQLVLIDLKAGQTIQMINVAALGITDELEGIDFQGDQLILLDNPGHFYRLTSGNDPVGRPTETKSVRTLSFSDAYRTGYNNNDESSGYDNTWTAATQDRVYTFTIKNTNFYGGQNDWTFVRVGWNKGAKVSTFTTDQPISEAIKDVVVNIQKFAQASNVNSITLEVADNLPFTGAQKVTADKSLYKPGYLVFTVPVPEANQYYRLSFDMKKTSSNGPVQLSRVSFYPESFAAKSIRNTPATAYTVAQARKLYDEGEGLLDTVYVKGKVVSYEYAVNTGSNNGKGATNKKRATVYLSDTGNADDAQIKMFYSGYHAANGDYTDQLMADSLAAGREVTFYGTLAKWSGNYELGTGCYLVPTEPMSTGIRGIRLDGAEAKAPAYNLAGRQVEAGYKGIVVRKGHKYLQK